MIVRPKYAVLAATASLAIILGACGPAASNESIIATSVAQTVQAQDTEKAAVTATRPPVTPSIAAMGSPTALTTKAPPTAPTGGGNSLCTASASFIDETIPDGAI